MLLDLELNNVAVLAHHLQVDVLGVLVLRFTGHLAAAASSLWVSSCYLRI